MASLKDIYNEYGKAVYGFLLKLTGDEGMADELLQETFYRAVKNIDSFEGRCSLMTWLCQIGKNAYFKECRRKKRFADMPPDNASDAGESPEEQVIRADDCRRIREALYHLDEPYRSVFSLRVFGDHSYKDIGGIYGKTEIWARVTYFRAKEKILQEVEK